MGRGLRSTAKSSRILEKCVFPRGRGMAWTDQKFVEVARRAMN